MNRGKRRFPGRTGSGRAHGAGSLKAGKADLPQGLVGEDRHGVGKVQAAGPRQHGQAQAAFGVGGEEILGKAPGLLAEKEPAPVAERRFVIGARRFGGRQPDVGGVAAAAEEIVQTVVDRQVQAVPVVEAGALDGLVGNVEAQGRTRCSAQPVTEQVREMLPVLAGISGSTKTILIIIMSFLMGFLARRGKGGARLRSAYLL